MKKNVSENRITENLINQYVGAWTLNLIDKKAWRSLKHDQIFGYDTLLPDWTFDTFIEHVIPEDREVVKGKFENATATGTEWNVECRILRKDGIIRWIWAIGSPVLNKNGEPVSMEGIVQDITELKQAENLLKERNQFLTKLNNSLESVVFTVDLESRNIEYVNNRVEAVFGYSPDECIGNTTRFLYPDKQSFIDYGKQMQNALQKNQEFLIVENTLRKKNGELFSTDITTSFLDKTKVVAVITDITDKKKAEQDLIKAIEKAEENGEFLRAIFENSKDAIGISHKGISVLINNAYVNMFGYENENEIIGKLLLEQISPREHERITQYFSNRYIGKEAPDYYEVMGIRKNGEEIPLEISVGTLLIKNEKYSVGVMRDISEHIFDKNELIKAKEKAEESEYKFKTLFNELEEGVSLTHKGILVDVNDFMIKKLGYQNKSEIIGKSLLDFMTKESKEICLAEIKKIHTNQSKNSNDELTFISKNGNQFTVEMIGSKIKLSGKIYGLTVHHDITERRTFEQEIILAKEKAEESDRLKSAFLANMSHEIRTPMNGILGFTQLLKKPSLTGEQQQKFIDIIQKSGNRMLNTVNDIIEISKIETGQIDVSSNKVNISKHILNLCEFFTLEAEKKDLKLIFDNGLSDDESIIQIDKNKFSSILTNLIKNAIKFTNKGNIVVGCKRNAEKLELFVKDTGIGIPEDRLDAVFERFVQADIEDKNAYQGSGLGLAISKSYVEMLGGKMWVESEEKKGTTFYFTLPYTKELKNETGIGNDEPNKVEGDITEEAKLKNLKILVAEDDEVSYSFLKEVLKEISSEVILAINGKEAINMCYNNPDIDLVLMDIKMPEMGGYEATAKIREFNKDMVIIAQTAYGLAGDREKAIEAGCNDYISKPVDMSLLNELIKKYCNIG